MAIHKVDGVDGENNFPKKFVRLRTKVAAGDTLSAGDWVAIDLVDTENGLGGTAVKAPATAGGAAFTFGVATETIDNSSGGALKYEVITIQTAGKYVNANVATASTAGLALTVDNATDAGRADIRVDGDEAPPCAVALEDATSNTADVMIINKGYF